MDGVEKLLERRDYLMRGLGSSVARQGRTGTRLTWAPQNARMPVELLDEAVLGEQRLDRGVGRATGSSDPYRLVVGVAGPACAVTKDPLR